MLNSDTFMYTACNESSVAAFVRTSMRSSNSCCLMSVEPKRRESREVDEVEELSTTTPTGLNHKILS